MKTNLQKFKIKKEVYILTGKVTNRPLLEKLKEFVMQKAIENISEKTNVFSARTEFKSLLGNNEFFGFIKEIRDTVPLIWTQHYVVFDAWGNVYKGAQDHCKRHSHYGTTAFCGILYLSEEGPGTYFDEINVTVKEEFGKFILFSPLLYHQVPEYYHKKERVVVVFNCDEHKYLLDPRKGRILK